MSSLFRNLLASSSSCFLFFHTRSSSHHSRTRLIGTIPYPGAIHHSLTSGTGRAHHALLIISGQSLPSRIASKLITLYVESGQFADARHLFVETPHPHSLRIWTVLLSAFSQHGYHEEAVHAFCEMHRHGAAARRIDRFVLPSILKSCGRLSDLRTGECIHTLVVKHSMEADPFVTCGLVNLYSKCGPVERARKMFDGMPQKDLASLNALVSGYAQHGFSETALALAKNAGSLGVKPDLLTWNSIISGFSHKADDLMVAKVFEMMVVDGVEPDIVSWTSVISGFVRSFRIRDALRAFSKMLASGIRPNADTISSVLPACASLADLRHGTEIHGYAVTVGLEREVFVRSALVDMYAKCDFISHARTLFSQMSERSSVSWNTMIFALANHSYCNEAIQTFAWMEAEDRRRIDHLTFTAALTACSHGGMTELGQSLFKKMQEVYRIKPRLEHYACMVDLLGRGGKLLDAYDLIRSMPMEPDFFVWGALLGSCRIHGDTELAVVAAQHLSKLEPRSPGNSLLLSGLYANAGGWRDAMRLKRSTQRRKMRKFLGRSWIELGCRSTL